MRVQIERSKSNGLTTEKDKRPRDESVTIKGLK